MIWRCACGRPNLEEHIRCVDCGETRPSGSDSFESPEDVLQDELDALEREIGADSWRRPPASGPGFVGRALRRTLVHYRRILGPFLPGLVVVVLPIQISYIQIAEAVVKGKAASLSTIGISAALTVLVTLASYYVIILTAFSIRDESVALTPFYTRIPWGTLGVLWATTVAYGLSIFFGFFLFVLPGLVALTLFCLMQPLVVLDGSTVKEALRASPKLVMGKGGMQALQVFSVIALVEVALTLVSVIFLAPLASMVGRMTTPALAFVFEVVAGGLFFPLHAVVLTVIYDELVGIPRPRSTH